MKTVAIILADSNGKYPVPAVKGGAVSTLVEQLIAKNSVKRRVHFIIITYYDKKAEEASQRYKNVEFRWIKTPYFIELCDRLCFWFVKTFLKNHKSISYKSIFSLVWFIWKASSLLKKETFDKLILENNIPLAHIIKISKYNGQYFYHLHNVPRIDGRCKNVFENCSAFLCVSQFVANEISSKQSPIGKIDKKKIKVLYNCIDTEKFHKYNKEQCRKDLSKKYEISERDNLIVFVGRLSPEKGIDKLLEAVSYLKERSIKVLIVGSYMYNVDVKDEYQIKLKTMSEEMKGRVLFTGYISQEELPKVYSAADIVVLPSMWDEPAGLTMIEAMACGVPVITTNSGGIPEYVGDSAYIVEKDNNMAMNIAGVIEKILFNNKSDLLVNSGIKRIHDEFSSEDYLDKFLECIGIKELR